jgi:hypothetical protein
LRVIARISSRCEAVTITASVGVKIVGGGNWNMKPPGRCLFAAVSFAVHARSNGVRRRSRGRLKCDPLGAHEPFDEPRSIIDYLRTKRPRSRNEHPTNCGRWQLHS